MGLDAVVYFRPEKVRVPEPYRAKVKVVDKSSGMLDFEEGWDGPYSDGLIAAEERIGNAATIWALRCRIKELCGDRVPIVLRQVLGNAFGASTPIPRSSIESLEKELDLLEGAAPPQDELILDFLGKLRRLCRAAIEQGNAIILC